MKPGQVALVGLLLAVFALEAVGQLSFSPPEEGFWVNADEGWWTDVVILADGSGPPDFLRALEPDALNWCHWELPMFLAELGTKRVGSTHLGYQESLERAQGDLAGWKWTHALAYNVYDRPVYYGDWGGSYFMDPHAPEWADAVLAGIRESLSGADGVSQDNIGVPPFIKGQCGFSPREKAEFRAFLAENVSESALQPLGVDPSTLDIAAYIRQHDYTDGSALAETDPIYRAFVLYQYVSNLQIWRDMLDDIGIHELPDKIIHGNQYGVWSVWDSSPYPLLLSQLHQVIEIEYVSYLQAIPPGVRDSLLYKLGLASGNQEKPVWIRGIVYDWHRGESVLRTNHLRLLTASAYANGAVRTFEHGQGTPSGYSEMPAEAEASLLQYYGWLDEVRFLFERRRSAANVAIVYSIPTMMWRFFPATGHWNSSQIGSLSGFADLLERNHIPYDALIFGHPAVWDDAGLAERMAAYDLLILPDVDCISLEQISALQAFLEQGGRILCTGDVGLYDEDLEARPSSVLADVLMSPDTFCLTGTPAQEYFQQGVARQDQASVRSEQAILTAAIRAAMGTEHIVETDAPETVCVNVFQTRDEGFSVHLLNLDYDEMGDLLTPSDSLVLRIRPPAISITAGPVWFFADDGTASALASELDDGWIEVRVPPFQSHAIIHIGSLSEHAKAAIEAAEDSMAANRWVHGDPLIDTLLEQARTALDAENALDALSYCAELERLITSRTARVAYDFSHAQQAALDWESARTISKENPEWFLLEGLAGVVTDQLDSGPIGAEGLQGVHALVIAPHRMKFATAEVEAIRAHVDAGAGLLFIGNGGPTSAMGALSQAFGLEFLPYGCLGAEDHLWDFVSFRAVDIAEHPVTEGVSALQLNYAAAMTIDENWTPLILTGPDTWQETGEDQVPTDGELRGPFPAVAVRTLGDGRIAAICDDAPFAEWGAPGLVHNLIDWLTGG